jgi:hypothetical protein
MPAIMTRQHYDTTPVPRILTRLLWNCAGKCACPRRGLWIKLPVQPAARGDVIQKIRDAQVPSGSGA